MTLPKTLITVMAGAAIVTMSGPSLAHEGATGIVKERMDAMTASGNAMKAAGTSIRTNRNLASIKDEALTVAANAARIPALFPPGSDQKPTEAKPEIWSHWDDFMACASQSKDESARLAIVADTGDPGAIGAQFRIVAKTCADCHDLYRVKR